MTSFNIENEKEYYQKRIEESNINNFDIIIPGIVSEEQQIKPTRQIMTSFNIENEKEYYQKRIEESNKEYSFWDHCSSGIFRCDNPYTCLAIF
jgi:hypothetical protein